MDINTIGEYSDELLPGINALLPQLSASAGMLTKPELEHIISSDTTTLVVAKDGHALVGCLTLVMFRIPTGKKAWIEDVVVAESARGQGIGHKLLSFALELSRSSGAKTVDLTSRPAREAANALYRKTGFQKRGTNVYRFDMDGL